MTIFSSPALDETVKTTLDTVVAELAKQWITAETNESSGRMNLGVGYTTILVVESTCYGFGDKVSYKFPSLPSKNNYRNALCPHKTFKGESKDLVAKLVASVVERCQALEADTKRADAKKVRQEKVGQAVDSLKAEFPSFNRNIRLIDGAAFELNFSYISTAKARQILDAIQAAGVDLSTP